MAANLEKLKELMVYIASRLETDDNLGRTKLNKLLYFSDFYAYAKLGKSITGATYLKQDRGPVPSDIGVATRELEESYSLVFSTVTHYNRQQHRPIAIRDAVLNKFTAAEISLVGEIVDEYKDLNAAEISDYSHIQSIGWQLAEPMQEIPYSTVFVSTRPPSSEVLSRAKTVANQLGL